MSFEIRIQVAQELDGIVPESVDESEIEDDYRQGLALQLGIPEDDIEVDITQEDTDE